MKGFSPKFLESISSQNQVTKPANQIQIRQACILVSSVKLNITLKGAI